MRLSLIHYSDKIVLIFENHPSYRRADADDVHTMCTHTILKTNMLARNHERIVRGIFRASAALNPKL